MNQVRIGINCGHTVSGAGYGAVGIFAESVETRNVGHALMDLLQQNGVEIVDCTIDQANTQSEYLAAAVALANRQDLDWFISIHFNASTSKQGHGVEVYTYEGRQYPDAVEVCANLEKLGFTNRGVKSGSGLYVVRKTKAKAMLIEVCFCDNEADADLYQRLGAATVASAVFAALCDVGAVPEKGTPIMGEAVLTEEQISKWMIEKGKEKQSLLNYLHLPQIFLEEGALEGVRGDLAFCQSVKETGYFAFGGDVVPEQHNYAGLGTTGGGVKGCYFENDQIGVRAQIQHLKGYASAEPLNSPCVDPRYDLVSPHGKAATLESLGGKWAVPGYDTKKYSSLEEANAAGDSYGYDVLKIYEEILNFGMVNTDGIFYVNVAGISNTEEECRSFEEFLSSHGINTKGYAMKLVREL